MVSILHASKNDASVRFQCTFRKDHSAQPLLLRFSGAVENGA